MLRSQQKSTGQTGLEEPLKSEQRKLTTPKENTEASGICTILTQCRQKCKNVSPRLPSDVCEATLACVGFFWHHLQRSWRESRGVSGSKKAPPLPPTLSTCQHLAQHAIGLPGCAAREKRGCYLRFRGSARPPPKKKPTTTTTTGCG